MADALAQLLAQQQGIAYTPRENIYGQIGGTIAGALPKIVSPYASTGSNIATVLGGSLLAGLLGYQAKQEAAAQNQVLMPALTDVISARTRGDLEAAMSGVPTDMASKIGPVALRQLGTIQEQELLREQQALERAQNLQDIILKQQLKTDSARELARFKTDEEIRKERALEKEAGSKIWEKIPAEQKKKITSAAGAVTALNDLAKRFQKLDMTAIELQPALLVPSSDAALAAAQLQAIIPSTVKLLGDSGNLSVQEQENIKRSLMGNILSGSETIATRITQLAEMVDKMQETQIEQYKTFTKGDFDGTKQNQITPPPQRKDYPNPADFIAAVQAYRSGQ
jgi:hypothetical protein